MTDKECKMGWTNTNAQLELQDSRVVDNHRVKLDSTTFVLLGDISAGVEEQTVTELFFEKCKNTSVPRSIM